MFEFKLSTKEEREERKQEQESIEQLERATCGFTGHRPDKLGNCYSLKHPESIKISEKLTSILEQLIVEENISRFISGGAIGFDQIAFWTVHKLKKLHPKIINIVAVPFKNQACKWTDKETLLWYDKMLKVSDEVIYVDEIAGYGMDGIKIGEYHVAKMQKRNEYMVDESRIMIACWDGTRGGTGNCVNYITKEHKTLFQMNPKYDYQLEVRYGMNH
jgi:uncharacterized phage-like protein YoqJ